MIATSAIAGTFDSRYLPSASSVAAISFNTEFFAPGTTTWPCRGAAPRMTIRSESTAHKYGPTTCRHRRRSWGIDRRPAVASSRVTGRTDVAPVLAGGHDEAQRALTPATTSSKRSSARPMARRRHSPVQGPFTSYERTTVDNAASVDETIRYRLVIPWFGWLFALPVRNTLRHRPRGPIDAVVVASRSFRATPCRDPRTAGCRIDVGCVRQHAVHANCKLRRGRFRHRRARPGCRWRDRATGRRHRHPVRHAGRPTRPTPDHHRHRVARPSVVRARRHRSELLDAGRHADDRPARRAWPWRC